MPFWSKYYTTNIPFLKDSQNFTDYIFQYDIKDNQIIPIVVDK